MATAQEAQNACTVIAKTVRDYLATHMVTGQMLQVPQGLQDAILEAERISIEGVETGGTAGGGGTI